MKKYRSSSWISPKLLTGTSLIDRTGVFCDAHIREGEVVVEWGGVLVTLDDVKAGLATPHTQVAISEAQCLATPLGIAPSIDDYMNHSCDPNIWMQDEVTLVAKRDIEAGQELVADYAIWLNDPAYVMGRKCNCGSLRCRTTITGKDWKMPEVIKNNYPHFSPFLNERIRRMGQTER